MQTDSSNLFSKAHKKLIDKYYTSKSGHIGGGLSCLASLVSLFNNNFDAKIDKFVFSKGHNALALYTVLNVFNFLPDEEYETFYQNGTRLGGHPPVKLTNFLPFATGSLGHGPSLAAGLALAKKIKNDNGKVFCLCGDGEWQEGSCWEALSFSIKHLLDNLVFIIDCNAWQGYNRCADVIGQDYKALIERISSFGANTLICDGHNLNKLDAVFSNLEHEANKPLFIFLKTVKGHGLPEFADTIDCHYLSLSEQMFLAMTKDKI